MQKLSTTVLLVLMLVLPMLVFPQYSVLPTSTQKEINRLNKKIKKSLRKYNAFSKKDTTVQVFTFFSFRTMDTISKEELIDGSFLRNFKHSFYYDYKDKYYPPKRFTGSLLGANTFIYSIEKKVIAMFEFDRRCFFESIKNENYYRLSCFDALVKHIWNQKNLLVFNMNIGDICTYFIVNDHSEIYVFYEERENELLHENYRVVSMSEYLDEIGIDYLNARGARIKK